MAGNSFGTLLRISTFGESHGVAIGVVIDGFPASFKVDIKHIEKELQRRKPGQSHITTQRKETEKIEILSGILDGKTLGTPIAIIVRNNDQRSKDYQHLENVYRPSHADYTYEKKYGIRDVRGGGRASARETVARVIAGALAKQYLLKIEKIAIDAYVSQVADIKLNKSYQKLNLKLTEQSIVRCPDKKIADQMIKKIEQIKKKGDSVGGIVSCVIKGCPVGLGEPVFDKLHADLGKAMLSINAVKGFEYGSGFEGTTLLGSQHNDIFQNKKGKIITKTNHSGGIQGGISNGMDIYFNVAFKPVATIIEEQDTIDYNGKQAKVTGKGRHDPCVLPRAVPIVESMAAIVLMDHYLRNQKL